MKNPYFSKDATEPIQAYLLWGIFISLVLTVIGWLFRQVLTPSNILLLYMLGVFFVALRFGFWPSILATLTIIPAFAYFFAPPIFSLAIADHENLIGLLLLLSVAGVTSNLAKKIRHQAYMAEQREWRASVLYSLSKELAEASKEKEIIEIGVRYIYAEFGAHNTFIFPDEKGLLTYPIEAALDISLKGFNLGVATWVFKQGEIAGNNANSFPHEPALYVPVNSVKGTIGVLALGLEKIKIKDFLAEQRQLLDTYVYQIVHTLERAHSAELAKNAILKMQSESLRNSLLSSISHDLRTPLATIVGAASTLETDGAFLDEHSKNKLVTVISQEAQRMSDLTIKILEMARLEAGEVILNRQWYAPEEIIGSALQRLDKKLKNRPITIHMPDNLALIQIDAVLLQQVMVNLLDNAEKYSPHDLPIDISVVSMPLGLLITIADRGPGIPENVHQKIFEKFFRVNDESAQSGVGLGLSICKAIIEAHDGEIRVSNRSGGGALFQVYLPLLEPPPIINEEVSEFIV